MMDPDPFPIAVCIKTRLLLRNCLSASGGVDANWACTGKLQAREEVIPRKSIFLSQKKTISFNYLS